ncbi:MAG: MBL fold metallo-hydrolase [Rhodobacteraceae bacterium]|nr:MBL fold metallo-hydrolase [Paracoccaceae bacterium]
MTYWGTNTYVIGTDPVVIVDPGPNIDAHSAAILGAVGGATCKAVLVTHAHIDHSDAARLVADRLSAPVLAYGRAGEGRSPVMERLAEQGLVAGGEGIDAAFAPDERLRDGDDITCGDFRIGVLETPGHFAGHLSFTIGDAILSGDLVMGWASTLISPPDGDLGQFLKSCARLRAEQARVLLPGHGPAIEDPQARINWLIAHRAERTHQILEALKSGPQTADDLTNRIYSDTPTTLLPAAKRNVLAHLIDLVDKNTVAHTEALSADTQFHLT